MRAVAQWGQAAMVNCHVGEGQIMNDEQGYWRRFGQQRSSRRRVIQGMAGGTAAIAGVGLAACAGNEQPATTTPNTQTQAVAQPKRGGVLNHMNAFETLGYSLDPQGDIPSKGEAFRLVYQGLLNYHPVTYEVQPEIAQKWEQPDNLTYVFSLQPGVKWQNRAPVNGRDLTVQDVVYSLERSRTADPLFTGRSLLESADKFEAVNSTTLKITAKVANADLISKFAADSLLMLAPEVVEKAGKFQAPESAVGTGPFIATRVEESIGAEFTRNPNYWRNGLPYLDGVRTFHFGDPGNAQSWAAYLAGRLDIIVVPGRESKTYITQQGASFTPNWYNQVSIWIATPNTKVKPFDDARVTKALRLLTDHEEFKTGWSEVWYGRGRHGSFFPTALEDWDFTEQEYSTKFLEWKTAKDDAAKEAISLLSAAGFTKDNPLRFELTGTQPESTGAAGAQLLQDQWKRLGQGVVEVTRLRILDNSAYQQARANRDYAYGYFTNAASFNDIDTNFSQMYYTGVSRNYWNVSDTTLDGMIDKQRTIFDVNQRKAFVKEMLTYMIDKWPGAVFTGYFALNATKPTVRGFIPEFRMHGAQYEQIWLDA
jgi:peptide/nickel transport system substrate-binding protein